MSKKILSLSLFSSIIMMTACQNGADKPKEGERTQFFEVSGMDSSVKASEDFFLFANGGWMKTTKIPDDKTGWGSFYLLGEQNKKNLNHLLEEAANKKDNAPGSIEQKLGDFYASGMDTAAIEAKGATPLQPELQKIDAITDYKALINYAADGFKAGNGALFGFYVAPDDMNSTVNIAVLTQTGTGLPEKDYYLKNDPDKASIREEYVKYIAKLFQLTGSKEEDAKKAANEILALETAIAKTHRSAIELRDPHANYNKMTIAQLSKLQPEIDWNNAFERMGVKVDSLNVGQPDYYKALGGLLKNQPIAVWKNKMKFDYINGAAGLLSKDFRNASFEFYGKRLSGQKQQEARWKQVTNAADGGLGDLLGQLYVKNYFPPEAKKRMDELVSNLQKAFANRIDHLDWMSAETKAKAKTKLSTIMKKIGYPEKWKTYDDVTIDRSNYFANRESIDRHAYAEMIKKHGKPVDKTEWGMTPATVNAYYNPQFNEIVFPAGILQFPFFDPNADDAINYGGIGMVIGHEMTHGFDDQGCQYDEKGNMVNWWTKEDAAKFKAKTGMIVDQYNAFTLQFRSKADSTKMDTLHVKGALTLGENIADFGGVAIAYDAFKMTEQGKSDKKIDGFTPDQRFFLGLAQVWRIVKREEMQRMAINVDPHSPAHYRINGPLSNFEPFYKAWGIQVGDKMFRDEKDRAKVW